MSTKEQVKYDKYLESFAVSEGEIRTARYEGKEEGRQEGRQEGQELAEVRIILAAHKKGKSISTIAEFVDKPERKIKDILVKHGLLGNV